MAASDFRINSLVRSVFARHWIDLQRVRYASFGGAVRVSGELCVLGGQPQAKIDAARVEILEAEIRRLNGVKQVYFDLSNWRQGVSGAWENVKQHRTLTDNSDDDK